MEMPRSKTFSKSSSISNDVIRRLFEKQTTSIFYCTRLLDAIRFIRIDLPCTMMIEFCNARTIDWTMFGS
jgi:hypothetical protein